MTFIFDKEEIEEKQQEYNEIYCDAIDICHEIAVEIQNNRLERAEDLQYKLSVKIDSLVILRSELENAI